MTLKEIKELASIKSPVTDVAYWDTEQGKKMIDYHALAIFKDTTDIETIVLIATGEVTGDDVYDVYKDKVMSRVLELHAIYDFISTLEDEDGEEED